MSDRDPTAAAEELGEEEFTIGVEEEFQTIDAETRELRPRAEQILPAALSIVGEEVSPELRPSQIEIETPVSHSLGELREELGRLRRELAEAAEQEGSLIAAAGTHPFSKSEEQGVTEKQRYREIAETYQQLAQEQLIFGCHVHVNINDRDVAVRVMDRTQPWLAVLKALSTNSPFWQGQDTGYASYRTALYDRWPMSGTPDPFGSEACYDEVVEDLTQTESIPDETFLQWDVRLSARYGTVEFRVADVCMTVDETVMVAGLARSLARACYDQVMRDEVLSQPRPELLRAARWRAARFGTEGDLVDLMRCRSIPARQMVEGFLDFLRADLEEHGEWDELAALVGQTLQRGTGARRQREALERGGELSDVVDLIVKETLAGLE
jgi:carboxylate-amine ligase